MEFQFRKLRSLTGHGKKTLLVCRSSRSDEQSINVHEHGVGVNHQERQLQNWLAQNLIDKEQEIVVRIVADGASQGVFDAVVAALNTGLYKLLLVESLDRIWRDVRVYRLLELADQLDVRIVAVADNVDTDKH